MLTCCNSILVAVAISSLVCVTCRNISYIINYVHTLENSKHNFTCSEQRAGQLKLAHEPVVSFLGLFIIIMRRYSTLGVVANRVWDHGINISDI